MKKILMGNKILAGVVCILIVSTGVSGFTYSDGNLSNAVGSNEEIPNDNASLLNHFVELRNPFGVAFGEMFRGEEFMPYIRDLGVNITKMSLHWYQIEPQNDVYDMTLVDAYVDQLHEDDEVLLNIFTSSDWGAEGEGKGYPPLDYDEYYDFIYDLVEHTNGKIKYFQRDTEPASQNHWDKNKPEEYVETQKYFYNAVKAANPDAVVIGVNQNGFFTSEGEPENKEFFEYVIREGKDYFDILDIRLYGDKYTISERVQWFRDKMNEYGYEKPIFTTEYAGPTPFEFPVEYTSFQEKYNRLPEPLFLIWIYLQKWTGRLSPQMEMFLDDINLGLGLLKNRFTDLELEEKRHRIECRDITARTVLALSSGVEKCWWWNLIANDQPALGIHHPIFGKLRLMEIEDWSKRPAYYAFQRMTDKLNGISSIEQIDVGNEDIFLFEVKKADTSITYILWEKRDLFYGEEQPLTAFEFNCKFSMARITDVFGSEEILDTENGVLKLDISDTPIFIEEVAVINESVVENERVLLGVSPDGKGWLEEIDGQLVLHLSGTGYEMGYQHGYLLKEEIKRTINAYVYHGSESTGNPPASAKTVWNNVKPYVPQRYLDEIQGLADGAGIPLIDIQVTQVQAELESIFLCEQIAVWGSATVDGNLYHGRNFGFPIDKRDDSSGVAIQDHAIVIIAQPEGYNDLVLLSWPGFIGACNGMNDKGISLAINAGFNSIWNPGLARALRFRRALEEADDIDGAANILDHDKTVGGMLTLSDGKIPKAYAVEMHGQSLYAGEWNDPAEEHDGYYSIKDCVRRMNQYINPGLAETQTTPEGKTIGLGPPSQEYFAVSEFIEDHHGEMNLDLMKEVLITRTSHQGAEGGCVRTSVCRGSTLDFWVADAVGSSSSVDQNFYYYNLNTLLSSTIPDRPDDVMPQVAITSPAGGITVTGVVTIAGTASDNIGVSSVEIMVDDDGYISTDGTTTWSKTIDTSSWEKGSWHRIKVRAIDESGNGAIYVIGLKKKGGKDLEGLSWGDESKFIEEIVDILYDNENDGIWYQ